MSAKMFLGIDVSQKTLDVALLSEGEAARKAKCRSFDNTVEGHAALLQWLSKEETEQVHACLEATGAFAIGAATALREGGHFVSVINPARSHAFAKSLLKRTKTDKADARLLAQFCQTQRPEEWIPAPPEIQQLQGLVRRLENLNEMLRMEENRLCSGGLCEPVRQSVLEMVAHIKAQIAKTEQQIQDHIDQNPNLRRNARLLESIPSIGKKTAAAILAEAGDITRFATARQLAAYAGLTPRAWESGTSIKGKPRLSKVGSGKLRKALYMPAMTALRSEQPLHGFGQRLLKNGKCKMVVLAAAMRKLLHIAFGVLKSQRPFDPTYLQNSLEN